MQQKARVLPGLVWFWSTSELRMVVCRRHRTTGFRTSIIRLPFQLSSFYLNPLVFFLLENDTKQTRKSVAVRELDTLSDVDLTESWGNAGM